MQALPAYLAFFCLENSARELISERMSERHGADWWNKVSRFTELKASRNIVAHNNVLEKNEIDRIKMYLVDWVRQVG